MKKSLINQLVERALEPEPVDFNDALAKALSALRRYSAASVASAAARAMDVGKLSKIDQLRSAPWLSALLLKWKLITTVGPLHVGRDMPQVEFDQLRQLLWNADTAKDPASPGFNAMTMIRAHMAVQLEFQFATTSAFMRWPALIARLPSGHVNRRQFQEVMGMDAEAFMDLGMLIHTAALQSPIVHRKSFDLLRPAYGTKVDTYLDLMSRKLPELRDELRADPTQEQRGRSEVHELPYLRRYPLLQVDAERLASWHPAVLARGIEDAAHFRLSRFGDAYAQAFGPVFEKYVLELVTEAGLPFVPEERLKRESGAVKVVEALIESDGCNVYVEAKMGLFPDQLLIRDDPVYLYERTKNIRTAIAQGWDVSDSIRAGGSADALRWAKAEQDFLLVVTSRELYLGGGILLQRLYPAGRFDYPEGAMGERIRSNMPMQNIFIVSISEFELVMGHVQASGRPLAAVLRDAARANADPQTAAYTLGMHLKGVPGRKGPALLRQAMSGCGERLQRVLDPTNPVPWHVQNHLE